jgi:hypothetical protein
VVHLSCGEGSFNKGLCSLFLCKGNVREGLSFAFFHRYEGCSSNFIGIVMVQRRRTSYKVNRRANARLQSRRKSESLSSRGAIVAVEVEAAYVGTGEVIRSVLV